MQGREIMKELALTENIESKILILRGKKVLLDRDLAVLYGVETRRLNEQVKRNIQRFPEDFMFQLTEQEFENLRSQNAILEKNPLTSQIAILKSNRGKHRKYLPYAFTEQGVAMLSSVLRSERAVQVNIMIMRTFVRIREIVSTHTELAKKISDIEKRVDYHDETLIDLIEAVKKLLPMSVSNNKQKIGFVNK